MDLRDEKSIKFIRDGAKYVCKRCKAKYFTKIEVEKCFDSHPSLGPAGKKK
jgi:hypothetical protein